MYEAKNFEHLLGLDGFSETALKNHFTLYQGYVNNANKLAENLKALLEGGKAGTPEYAEQKRRFGWEFNGMRLHELYFGAMSKNSPKLAEDSKLFQKITKDFGSYENWEKDFREVAAMRGIGWGILYYDKLADRLSNVWVNEHDVGHLAGAEVVLNIDVFEHAFMADYGLKRADYIEAFMKAVDWGAVSERI
ncbi:MAG: Fe-Mn family superoxide dismutase [Patescibacteria group bacterium]